MYDHKAFFDSVRGSLFGGSLKQHQVDGMEAMLTGWETYLDEEDPRFAAYMLATTYHETSKAMQPIEEYGKGEGQPYAERDPETGQCYYGRGFVQLTWRDNYSRADHEAGWFGDDSCEWHADNALDLHKAAVIMWFGMTEGWFRSDDDGPQTLARYFNAGTDDPFGAREIINGDKNVVPDWSNGASIGYLVQTYHGKFLDALAVAWIEPQPVPEPQYLVDVVISAPKGVQINVTVTEKEE